MSYRSDVCIVITKEQIMKSMISNSIPPMLTKEDVAHETSFFKYWYFEYVAWDERIPEVKEVMDYLKALDNAAQKSFTEFGLICIGEETGDIETLGDFENFDIFPETLITVPWNRK